MAAGHVLLCAVQAVRRRPICGSTERRRKIKVGVMQKKVARILKRIRRVPGLSEDEKYLFARTLAATPDERWRLHQNFLRSLGLSTRSMQKKFRLLSLE